MLKIEQVCKSFGKRVILDHLSLSVEEGEFISVFGESGSGKSTFLNIVSTLLKPDEGKLSLQGFAYSSLSKKKQESFRVENFSYIPPEANLLSPLTAEENILFPLSLQKLPYSEEDFNSICRTLSLNPLLKSPASSLSSGEQQRVAVARALLLKKKVLIADEPTSHLDADLSKVVVSLLREEAKKNSSIVLCACHDRTLIEEFDKVYFLKNGVLSQYEEES